MLQDAVGFETARVRLPLPLAEFGPEASTVVDYTTRLFILYRDPGDPVGSLLNGSPVQETGCGTGGGYRLTAHFGPDITQSVIAGPPSQSLNSGAADARSTPPPLRMHERLPDRNRTDLALMLDDSEADAA